MILFCLFLGELARLPSRKIIIEKFHPLAIQKIKNGSLKRCQQSYYSAKKPSNKN